MFVHLPQHAYSASRQISALRVSFLHLYTFCNEFSPF